MQSTSLPEPTRRRTLLLALLTAGIALVIALALGEFLVRWIAPQETMTPRSKFSSAYGIEFHPNRVMVNELSGQWRFAYTTNEQGHRGPVIPVSNAYPKPNVVVLGDSFTFGYGVADGQEYPAQLRELLQVSHGVINLGVGGWGLTQEIRRYYELGRLYEPQIVVLQFTSNDPVDNMLYPVTSIENGRFRFRDRNASENVSVVKRLLSDSSIQHSHLYAFARARLYYSVREKEIAAASLGNVNTATDVTQRFHADLLDLFARDLSSRGIRLLMIAVEKNLEPFPIIRQKMQQLSADGKATYLDVEEWFKTGPHDYSPEGHWGAATHRTVAEGLAREIVQHATAVRTDAR